MKIDRLKLTHFKNYKSESFLFNPKYNAIVGYNGMGKTNLLDAIYFSCMTKSNFSNTDRNLITEGEKFFRVEASIDQKKVVSKYGRDVKKVFEVNGKAHKRLADHIGDFPVVFIVPFDQNLLLEGSSERRKLMDNSISQIDKGYLEQLIKYNSLLQQRNAYLKLGQKGGHLSENMLMTYSEQMNSACESIHLRRKAFAEDFEIIFQAKYATISGHQEVGTCTYKSHLEEEESYLEQTRTNLDKDKILGRTSIGIHKDDLIFKMNNKSVKTFASQGQTKSFILALKLSQFKILADEKGIKPILLLDDLFDKLDHKRVQQLIELLEVEEVEQVFISDTDTERVVNILEEMNVPYKKIVINEGSQINEKNAGEEE